MITVITSMNVDILNFSGTENHNFSNIHSFGNGVSDSVEENLRRDFLIDQGILLFGKKRSAAKTWQADE